VFPNGNDGWDSTFAPTLFQCHGANNQQTTNFNSEIASVGDTGSACTLAATFANGRKLTGSLSSPTSFTWMPGSVVWHRTTPSNSCLGSWTDSGGFVVVVSSTSITGPGNGGWYPAVITAATQGVPICQHLVTSAHDCFAAARVRFFFRHKLTLEEAIIGSHACSLD
jgi:hypothetical protein